MATKSRTSPPKRAAKKTAKPKPRKSAAPKAAARRTPAPKPKAAAKKAAPKATPARAAAAKDGVRALAKRIVDLTLANDDEGTFALYHAEVESSEMGQPPTRGLEALRTKFEGWRNFVSEAHFEPRRVCVDGDTIVIEWIGRVVLAASGKPAELHEVAIHEVRNGKIVREAFFYNPAALA